MKINISEMMRIKSRMSDINNEIATALGGINTEFENISNNIQSYNLQQSINKFQSNVSNLSKDITINIKELETFAGNQIQSYTVTNEEAKSALGSLVTLLNETFDENGNTIVKTTSVQYSSTPTSNVVTTAAASPVGSAVVAATASPVENAVNTSALAPTTSTRNINPPAERHLTRAGGVFAGPAGKETYYNLNMNGVVSIMRSQGFSEAEYPYWVRDDGVKMLGDYVMVAADFNSRPRGTILETSLGTAIVCDTGSFAASNPSQVDIAVSW